MRSTLLTLFLCLAGLARAQTPPSVFADQAVTLNTATGVIHGSLLVPAGTNPVPVVLIIAGSGPTDRNGNIVGSSGPNDSLKLLAAALAEAGIASLRYDKRGVAQSKSAGMKESDLRFETYVADAATWLHQLRKDRRFSTVSVLGHSEGSLIGMLAIESSGADAFVSIAGVARRVSDVLRDQLRQKLDSELAKQNERILATLERGQLVDSVPPALSPIYRPSVQPYLISWMHYAPETEIKKLSLPVLIAQGTTDIQVSLTEAKALKKSKPEAALLVVEGMNHVLKKVPADPAQQEASYVDPSLPLAPELVESIRTFIRAVRPKSKLNLSFNSYVPS